MCDTINEEVLKIIQGLCEPQKLLRDRSLTQMKTNMNDLSGAAVQSLTQNLLSNLEGTSSTWEMKHGSLEGLRVIILHEASIKAEPRQHETELWEKMRSLVISLLTDQEVRVRQAAGCLLGAMCSQDFGETYRVCRELILNLVKTNLERQPNDPDFENEGNGTGSVGSPSIDQLKQKLVTSAARERRYSGGSDAKQIFHDTAGWRNLESSLNALQEMIQGTGEHFSAFCEQHLIDLLMETLTHPNRFVRETGFGVCASLVSSGFTSELLGASSAKHVNIMVKHLALGLSDNWSQVRLAANVATRKFLTELPPQARHSYFPVLLPRICLNRYYVAEGVRLYSQETWRQVTGTEGRALVETYLEEVVTYYIEATEADNHAVREAACACIAELVTKLPSTSVQPFVSRLLPALFRCFMDESWPVRDAACVACGHFIQCFPDECKPHMDELYKLFFSNLHDSIPSVRQGAAVALGNVVQAYGKDALDVITPVIKSRLEAVKTQSSEGDKYSDLDTSLPATYGVVKKRRDNDPQLHENLVMYSCGSLAPKMGRGGGGCSDCRFKRDPLPWEGGDGALWLLGEMAIVGGTEGHKAVIDSLQLVSDVCQLKHYSQHITLLETLCKNLPKFCKGLGKRSFKSHLHLFYDLVFYALSCENSLTSSASSQCLTALAADLGANILRGRIEEHNPSYLRAFDGNNYSTPF